MNPYPLNSEEYSAYTLGYDSCQFGINKNYNPFKRDKLSEAYKRGYQDCAEINFGDREA